MAARVVEEPSAPELVVAGDLRLRIPPGSDETVLRRVIAVLGRC